MCRLQAGIEQVLHLPATARWHPGCHQHMSMPVC